MHFNFHTNQFTQTNIDITKPVIITETGKLLWGELQLEVEKLETILTQLGLKCGDSVIVYGHKEMLFPIAALALFKNDITYIPIDTVYPKERIKHIINQAGCNVIINCTNDDINIGQQSTINADLSVTRHHNNPLKSSLEIRPIDPIRYILFTSGSTGEPKGVQITKENIEAFINWLETDYNFTSESIFIAQANFSFDISLYDILGTFGFGGTMILIAKQLGGKPIHFTNHIKKHGGTTIIATPSFIYRLLRHSEFNTENLPKLKYFLLLGEELKYSIIKSIFILFPHCEVINGYGPTEATIATTMHRFTNNSYTNYSDSVPIGTSIPSGEAFLKDANATKDNPSEILLSGKNVSIGYLNNVEKNSEKFFISNNQRAFRTGDLGYKTDGLLYFCGRMDDMIKMHGYRIELGEISKHISNLPYVEQAETVPVVHRGEVKRILSFVIHKTNCVVLKETIIKDISKNLPEYMIPGDIIILNKFPTNNSGKTDKKELLRIYKEL